VVLAAISLSYMPYHPKYCTLAYIASCLLDAVDGQAARALDQTSKFGAVLDMVTDRYGSVIRSGDCLTSDRCATSCLLCFLASSYPRCALIFQALITLDFSSHYIHMYSYVRGRAEQPCSDRPARQFAGGWLPKSQDRFRRAQLDPVVLLQQQGTSTTAACLDR
jgi:phosphatidylglycerophosphate synthase